MDAASTLDLITITWEKPETMLWASIVGLLLFVLGCIGVLVIAFRSTARIGQKRTTLARIIGWTTFSTCLAVAVFGLLFLGSGPEEPRLHQLQYLEMSGTVVSVSVLDTISESNAGPARLGVRLDAHPQMLLSVDGDDVERFIGTEGNAAVLRCDVPQDLSTAVTLTCSSMAPVAGVRGLSGWIPLPADSEASITTTRTSIELAE